MGTIIWVWAQIQPPERGPHALVHASVVHLPGFRFRVPIFHPQPGPIHRLTWNTNHNKIGGGPEIMQSLDDCGIAPGGGVGPAKWLVP